MRHAIKVALIVGAIIPLSGCWFIFIPGSAVGAISDGITGSKWEYCVGNSVKVGDQIKNASGTILTVKSLSGTSSRCKEADKPIRAELSSQ